MHEQQKGRKTEKLGAPYSRSLRHRLSAVHRKNRLDAVAYIYNYDRSTWYYYSHISAKEFTNNLAIIAISAGGFGTGVAIFIQQLLRNLG